MASIQEMAQATQAVIPNNGNPNTVYNNAGFPIPQSGWTTNTVSPAANYTPGASGPLPALPTQRADYTQGGGGWTAPANSPTLEGTLGKYINPVVPTGWGGGPIDPTKPTPEVPTTPTQPTQPSVPDTSNWQWIVKNNKGVPGKNEQLYANDPIYRRAYDEVAQNHRNNFNKDYTKDSDANALSSHIQELYMKYSAEGGGGTPSGSWTGGTVGGGGGGSGSATNNFGQYTGAVNDLISGNNVVLNPDRGWAQGTGGDPNKLGEAINSTIDRWTNSLAGLGQNITSSSMMKFLDAVTEPFIPGNLYMSELGKANMANVTKAVMNKVVPGIGTLVGKIAEAIPANAPAWLQKIKNFFLEGKFQEAANEIYKKMDEETMNDLATRPFTGKDEKPKYGGGGGSSIGGFGGGSWIGGWGGSSGLGGRTGTVTVGDEVQVNQN